jgi:hypothetical protein
MLDITRINRGTMRFNLSKFHLKDSVPAVVVESMRPRARAKRLELASNLPRESMMFGGDLDRVGQILNNLLRNALNFTSRGRIAVSLRQSGSEAIRDTGVGWSRAELAKCSRPQFQARAAPVADWAWVFRWSNSFTRFRLVFVVIFCAMLAWGFTDAVHARRSDANAGSPVTRLEIRHVNFRTDPQVLFHIEQMNGELVPRETRRPTTFDDKRSFGIAIESGTVAISTSSLAALLNNYVLAYTGTPIRDVKLANHDGELVQTAAVHGIPATMEGKLDVTPEGLIRFTPESIKMAGVPIKKLVDALGAHPQKIVHPDESRGLKIVGDDLLLNINQFPMSPRLYGHVVGVRLEGDNVIETFAPDNASGNYPKPLEPPLSRLAFMYFHGGTIRFGKLTMDNTELEIVSTHRQDWLDFDLDHYNDQLTTGCAKTTPSFALIVSVPDYGGR